VVAEDSDDENKIKYNDGNMSPKLIPYDEAGYLMPVAIERNEDNE